MTQQDPLNLSLASELAHYKPGDTVTAVLLASTPLPPEDVELHDLEIKFTGIERVDTAWIATQYRSDVPAINSDRRRVQRRVVHAQLHAATQGNFEESRTRRFLIRFSLPEWLPPSYRGVAVKYSYFLEAKASYMLASGPQNSENLTLRLSIVVMPTSTQKEESNLGMSNALPDLPEMPIKCWEVGCGTSLDDAVDHISKLPLNGALNIPPTPFSPGRFQTDGAGGGAGLQMSPDELMRTRSLAKENSIASEKAVLSSHTSLTTSSLQGLSLSRENTVLESETLQFSQSVPDNSLNILGDLGFRTYALRLSDYPLARITIHFPPSGQLEPGGTFYGTLEFDKSENGIRCIQVSILLEQDEIINEKWRVSRGRQGSDGALCRVIDEFEEATVNTACTSFVFSLPNDAVSTFHTDLISISWALKFHFVALVTGSNNLSKKPRMERLTWTMPLTIFPPS